MGVLGDGVVGEDGTALLQQDTNAFGLSRNVAVVLGDGAVGDGSSSLFHTDVVGV